MTFIEDTRILIKNDEIKEASKNILEDAIQALLGDPVAYGKIIVALAKSPFFIREQLFWGKMEMFLSGIYLEKEDREKLNSKLAEYGNKEENVKRLLSTIDKVETKQKMDYLINATRCLLAGSIDLPKYYRVVQAITQTLEEDLVYLSQHIEEPEIAECYQVYGLATSGLMYHSVISGGGALGNGVQRYSFYDLAKDVDMYSISYNNINKYPRVNPNKK
jgi:hypothetical protein